MLLAFGSLSDARLRKRFLSHKPIALTAHGTVPDPNGTLDNLNELESSIRNWSEEQQVAVTTATPGSIAATTPAPGSVSIDGSPIDNLDARLAEIATQSNDDFSKMSNSMETNGMMVDLIRLNVSRLERDVKRNISRIDALLQDLGDFSTNGSSDAAKTTKEQVTALQTDVNNLKANSTTSSDTNVRLDELGQTVSSVDARVASMERRSTESFASQPAGSTTEGSESDSITAVIDTWTGRIALGALVVGLGALVLSILTFTKLPKQTLVEAPKAEDEEVLLEAQNVEEQPIEEEGVEEDQGEEEVEEQVE